MKIGRELKQGEVEITWNAGGATEILMTKGMSHNGAALIVDVERKGRVIIPMTSIRSFRIAAL